MAEQDLNYDDLGQGSDSIKAFCFKFLEGMYSKQWTIRDFILPEGNEVSEEYSITFWTKYFQLEDYDGDGVIDPIIIYGTHGMNDYDDGRIKILVYHNNKKRAIRHQNGTLDFERNTTVDKQFYNLPSSIQERVNEIMEKHHGKRPRDFPIWMARSDEEERVTF